MTKIEQRLMSLRLEEIELQLKELNNAVESLHYLNEYKQWIESDWDNDDIDRLSANDDTDNEKNEVTIMIKLPNIVLDLDRIIDSGSLRSTTISLTPKQLSDYRKYADDCYRYHYRLESVSHSKYRGYKLEEVPRGY